MHPWIVPDELNNSLPAKYSINIHKNQVAPTTLIFLFSLKTEMLPLIANFSFQLRDQT